MKGVGWCSGMNMGLNIRGRGFDSHKETWREFVKNIKLKREREMG